MKWTRNLFPTMLNQPEPRLVQLNGWGLCVAFAVGVRWVCSGHRGRCSGGASRRVYTTHYLQLSRDARQLVVFINNAQPGDLSRGRPCVGRRRHSRRPEETLCAASRLYGTLADWWHWSTANWQRHRWAADRKRHRMKQLTQSDAMFDTDEQW